MAKTLDKITHALMTYAITVTGFLFSRISIICIFIALAVFFSFAKETVDMREGGSGFSWYDIIADGIGIISAVAVGVLILL